MFNLNLFIFFFSLISFLILNFFSNIVLFLFFLSIWIIFFLFLIFKYKIKKEQMILYCLNFVSFLIIFILVEIPLLRIIICLFIPFTFVFINFWFQTNLKRPVYLKEKPLRRMMMFLLVFAVYSFLVAIFAFSIYFVKIPFFILAILTALYIFFISRMIWQMYFKIEIEKINYWSFFIALVIFELVLVFNFLPFGFFVSALLIGWLWYIIQLYIRFHLSPKGIIWEKQNKFLLLNLLLYIITLFIIRWV